MEAYLNLYEYFTNKTLMDCADKDAIIFKQIRITFSQLDQLIRQLSSAIHARIGPKIATNDTNIIGVHLEHDERTVAVLLAIHRLLCSYVPIDPLLPANKVEHIVNDAKPLCILTNVSAGNNSNLDRIKSVVDVYSLDSLFDSSNDQVGDNFLDKKLDPEDVACVLYTSGSTGVPKGVFLNHATIMNRLKWQWMAYPIDTSVERVALKTSLNFVDHIAEMFCFLLKGYPLVVIEPSTLTNPDALIDTICTQRITHFILVPSLLRNILSYAISKKLTEKLKSLKRFVCSGEALTVDLVTLFFEASLGEGTVLCNFYGSTEVMGDVTHVTFDSKARFNELLYRQTNVPIGVPIANSGIDLFDENMDKIGGSEDKIGEIYAHGLCLASGYLNKSGKLSDNDKDRFKVINGKRYFRTGDFGFFHNKMLYFSGRQDSQVKIRGKRFDLAELEHHGLKIKGVNQFIPLIFDPSEFDDDHVWNNMKFVVVFYHTKPEVQLDEAKMNEVITNELKTTVSDYMMPTFLVKLDEVPLLINGKIDKIQLKTSLGRKFNEMLSMSKNKNSGDLRETILSIMKLITGVVVTRDAQLDLSLNQLGINSLNAIEILLSVEKVLKLDAPFSFDEFVACSSLNQFITLIHSKNQTRDMLSCMKKLDVSDSPSHLRAIPFSTNKDFAKMVLLFASETFTRSIPLHQLTSKSQDKANPGILRYPRKPCYPTS